MDRSTDKELAPQMEQQVAEPYKEIEMPLSRVLVEMEMAGIRIDVRVLERMSLEMGTQLEDLTRRICEIADCEFNINSPRQLGEILFDKLNLPRPRKLRKSGQYSTAVEILEELAAQHELPRLVLEYRQLSKFKSTYIDVIPRLIDPKIGTSAHLFSSGCSINRAALQQQSQPPKHPRARRPWPEDSGSVRSGRRMVVRCGRLFTGGTAYSGPPIQ